MQAIGDKISSRSGHSAVLSGTGAYYFIQSEPVLATLDTTVNPMRWIIPNNSLTSKPHHLLDIILRHYITILC
ncbi:34930_t:CDS:2 [Gigaspora margarita]|uniref:34930_t:CDS:1 n=1 Tax=Gigaspora margarita TaxID=4874 RepID=A0ABN7V1Z4_GIGMA|nr:34930_t:CDS:2 [Gigaspora margarita]